MRTVPFREVLHGVAYKMGLDPDQSNFLTNQAIPIGTYINEWVRRTYDVKDWPEWVHTHEFVPDLITHIVKWDDFAVDLQIGERVTLPPLVQLGVILKVFLVDPRTTDAPIDTPFTLREEGVHVGYEHGATVWVRYLAPPPEYTAVTWRPDHTYAKGDIAYSYTDGEVYKSKLGGNINHDPAIHGAQNPPPPSTTITQQWTTDNIGLAQQNQILVISFSDTDDALSVPDPPAAGTDFHVDVHDEVTGLIIAEAAHVATGTESIDDIMADLASQLSTDPDLTSFLIGVDTTAKTITLENASLFSSPHSFYNIGDAVTHLLQKTVTQTYVAETAAVAGDAQITKITMNDETTHPGALYTMSVTGSNGIPHTAEYQSTLLDGSAQILNGLVASVNASTDAYFENVQMGFDPALSTLQVAVKDNAGVDVVIQQPPESTAFWEVVSFPKALADQVITGALGDLLNEWGQFDKGTAVQQGVGAETDISGSNFSPMPSPPLTTQQTLISRYRQ